MHKNMNKAAVLGAGVMGSQIAAHLANAGTTTLLYDISQEMAEKGLKNLQGIKPAAFYSPRYAKRITPCNYDDDLDKLREVDWIIEAVLEKPEIKRQLFRSILPHLKSDVIISSNTSGLSISEMISGLPENFSQHFLITHFFNPPRYMHLLEIIPGKNTLPEVIQTAAFAAENFLGKGIVYAKDTPNFIANRIGIYSLMLAIQLTREMHLTVEEVDKLTGPVIGHPKSATYRTADLVGVDTLSHVAQTSYQKAVDDESRNLFQIPDILKKLLDHGWLGEKTKKGFYQKVDREILSLDFNRFEYGPQKKVRMDGLRVAKRERTTGGKIHALAYSEDIAGKFVWELLANTLLYAARRIPEISEDIVNIDNAMRWGFGWELGPFETWEKLGIKKSVERMESEQKDIPDWIEDFVETGHDSFYQLGGDKLQYFDIPSREYRFLSENPKNKRLNVIKAKSGELKKNRNASLIDMGDGIACVEFHSIIQPAYNPLDGAMLDMVSDGLEYIRDQGYRAMIIGHQAQQFTAGINLALILKYAEEQNWKRLEELSHLFQKINQKVRFAAIPVVAAPFNLCLGGGFELSAACDLRVASAELYCGLVEVGVGLIPGGGGNLRLLLHNREAMEKNRPGPFPVVQKTFETIVYAKVSGSAKEAVFLGYLTRDDHIIINPDHLLYEAKKQAARLAENYQPPEYRRDIILPGTGGRLAIEMILEGLEKAGKISGHDTLIGKKLAYVLTGGEKATLFRPVDEDYLLDIERDAFVSLCAEPLSQKRMAHMLKTGKPLRN